MTTSCVQKFLYIFKYILYRGKTLRKYKKEENTYSYFNILFLVQKIYDKNFCVYIAAYTHVRGVVLKCFEKTGLT